MKIERIWYTPEADVEFTWTEVESMILLSERHYSYECKPTGEAGRILNGMRNRFEAKGKGATISVKLGTTEADLLCKVCEADPSMLMRMHQVFRALNEEWKKVNKANL